MIFPYTQRQKPLFPGRMRRDLALGGSFWPFNDREGGLPAGNSGTNGGGRVKNIAKGISTAVSFPGAGTNAGGHMGHGARGSFWEHTNANDAKYIVSDESLFIPNTGSVTVCLGYEKTDTTLRQSTAFGINEGALGTRMSVYLPWTDGTVYWDYGGATSGTTRLAVGSLTTSGYHAWAFTVGARGMELWQDGNRVGSNAATPTRTVGTRAFLLGNGANSGIGSDLARYYWLFVHRDQLPGAVISRILRDPFGTLMQPIQAKVFSTGTVATAFPWLYYAMQRGA